MKKRESNTPQRSAGLPFPSICAKRRAIEQHARSLWIGTKLSKSLKRYVPQRTAKREKRLCRLSEICTEAARDGGTQHGVRAKKVVIQMLKLSLLQKLWEKEKPSSATAVKAILTAVTLPAPKRRVRRSLFRLETMVPQEMMNEITPIQEMSAFSS